MLAAAAGDQLAPLLLPPPSAEGDVHSSAPSPPPRLEQQTPQEQQHLQAFLLQLLQLLEAQWDQLPATHLNQVATSLQVCSATAALLPAGGAVAGAVERLLQLPLPPCRITSAISACERPRRLAALTACLGRQFSGLHAAAALARLAGMANAAAAQQQRPAAGGGGSAQVQMVGDTNPSDAPAAIQQLAHQLLDLFIQLQPPTPPLRTHEHAQQHEPRCDAWLCTQVLWALGSLRLGGGSARQQQKHQQLLAACLSGLEQLGSRETTMLLTGLARLQLRRPPPPEQQMLLKHCAGLLPHCGAGELSVMLWALAKLGCAPSADWLGSYFDASASCLGVDASSSSSSGCSSGGSPGARLWQPQELGGALWALAVLGVAPPAGWLAASETHLLRCLNVCSLQDLSLCAWAWARLGQAPAALQRVVDAAVALLPPPGDAAAAAIAAAPCAFAADASSVALLLHAIGAFAGLAAVGGKAAGGSAGAQRQQPARTQAQPLQQRQQQQSQLQLQALLDRCEPLLSLASPQNLSLMLRGVARQQQLQVQLLRQQQGFASPVHLLGAQQQQQQQQKVPSERWLVSYLACATRRLPSLTPEGLTATVWALGVLLRRPAAAAAPLSRELAAAAAAFLAAMEPHALRMAQLMSPHDLSNLLLGLAWVAARITPPVAAAGTAAAGAAVQPARGLPSSYLLERLVGQTEALMPSFAPRELAAALQALLLLGRPAAGESLLAHVLGEERWQLETAGACELIVLLRACSAWRVAPARRQLALLLGRAQALLPAASSHELVELLWALAHLPPACGLTCQLGGMRLQYHQPAGTGATAVQPLSQHHQQQQLQLVYEQPQHSAGGRPHRAQHSFQAAAMRVAAARLPHLNAFETARLLSALRRLEWQPSDDLLDQLYSQLGGSQAAAGTHLPDPEVLTTALFCLAALHVSPPSWWVAAVLQHMEPHVARLNAQSVSELAWALGQLEVEPLPTWVGQLPLRARDVAPLNSWQAARLETGLADIHPRLAEVWQQLQQQQAEAAADVGMHSGDAGSSGAYDSRLRPPVRHAADPSRPSLFGSSREQRAALQQA